MTLAQQQQVEMNFIEDDEATLATRRDSSMLKYDNFNNQDDPIVAQPQPPSKIEYQPNTSFVTPIEKLGDEPEFIDCPFCNRRTQTRVERSHSPMT